MTVVHLECYRMRRWTAERNLERRSARWTWPLVDCFVCVDDAVISVTVNVERPVARSGPDGPNGLIQWARMKTQLPQERHWPRSGLLFDERRWRSMRPAFAAGHRRRVNKTVWLVRYEWPYARVAAVIDPRWYGAEMKWLVALSL